MNQRCTVTAGVVFLALAASGCGGSASSTSTAPRTPSASANAQWASRTRELCREKRAAIAKLGYVHITYAGIARAGLPAVKRSLDGYLGRLLAVLRAFSQRQRQLATPPSLVSTMNVASSVDAQSQAATSRLRTAVAGAATANELSTAFRQWLGTLQQLAARGDAVARRLNLSGCSSGSPAAPS